MTLSAGQIVLLRKLRASGETPSQMLRELFQDDPELHIGDLTSGLMAAFGTGLSAISSVNGWWHDGSGELDDSALDRLLEPVLGTPSNSPSWPVGARLGDGTLSVTRRIAGADGQWLCEGEGQDGPVRVTFSGRVRELSRRPEILLRGVDGVPPLGFVGEYARPEGNPGQVLAERVRGRSARDELQGPVPKARIAPILQRLIEISGALHRAQSSLQGVRPETIDIDGPRCTSASPRSERLFLAAEAGEGTFWALPLSYRAPESLDRLTHTEAADVFTLAVLASEWLSGVHPFAAPDPMAHETRLRRAELSSVEDPFLVHALELAPARRPTLDEMLRWLSQA